MRHLAVLWVVFALVLTGAVVGPCPDGRCASLQAGSMACCKQDGLTRPSCCDAGEALSHAVPPAAVDRAADGGVQHVVAVALTNAPLAATAPLRTAPRPLTTAPNGNAPPGSLIAQHTSLLL